MYAIRSYYAGREGVTGMLQQINPESGGTGNILTTIDPNFYKPKGGGGGGKGPSEDTIENRLQKLYEYLGQVEEYQIAAEEIAHQKREDTLKAALDKKLITLQEYNELEKEITKQHESDILAIQE